MNYKKNLSDYENLRLWDKRPIGEHVSEWAALYGDKIACITDGVSLSYNELEKKSSELAYGLIDKAEPVAYFIADKYQGFSYTELARELKPERPYLKHVIVKGDSEEFTSLDSVYRPSGTLPKIDGYAVAQYLLSGGTLGVPKMIPRTHADYMYHVNICSDHCKIGNDTVYLVSLPAEHNFPLGHPGVLGTLNVGGTVVFCENPGPDEVLDAITEYKVTITALVPTIAGMCAELMEYDEDYDLSSLRMLLIGGSRCEESLARTIMEKWPKDMKVVQVYGTTEGLDIMTALDDSEDIIAYYQGREVSGNMEVRLVDENGDDVDDGEVGEVICRGPYTIDHYYMADEANETSFTDDGFYKTGDSAVRTKDGLFRFVGRVKEQINRAGEKIDPGEIEGYLCSDERVLEAAVVGIPDEELNNRSCAFVRCAENCEISLNDVYDLFRELGAASYKFPDEIVTVDSWPLTKVGKIDKKQLVKMRQG